MCRTTSRRFRREITLGAVLAHAPPLRMPEAACSIQGEVHFHLNNIRTSEEARVFRLLVPGEDFCPATSANGPIANAAGLLVLAFSELRGAPPWAGMGVAKSGFERHCAALDPTAPDRCMGTLSALAHCDASQPWCTGAKWWLLRTLGADQLSRWSKLPGVWASAARSSGSEQHGATTPAGPSKSPSPTSPFPASPSPPDGEARSEEDAQAERTGKSHRPVAQEQEKSQFEREQEEGRRLEAEQDAAEEAERVRCREKGRRAAAHASPIARAWLEDDHRPAIEEANSALDSLSEALQCNPSDAELWPLFGILMHMHRQLPLSSLLALRHAVELQPASALAYSELGVVAFDQLLFGDVTKMGEMARVAQRALLAVRQLQPRLVRPCPMFARGHASGVALMRWLTAHRRITSCGRRVAGAGSSALRAHRCTCTSCSRTPARGARTWRSLPTSHRRFPLRTEHA